MPKLGTHINRVRSGLVSGLGCDDQPTWEDLGIPLDWVWPTGSLINHRALRKALNRKFPGAKQRLAPQNPGIGRWSQKGRENALKRQMPGPNAGTGCPHPREGRTVERYGTFCGRCGWRV